MSKIKHGNIPAVYLVLLKNEQILLLRRYNTGYEDGNYSLVAGHVEAGETFTQGVIREAREEAGIRLKQDDLEVIHVMHRDNSVPGKFDNERVDIFFFADKWDGEIINKEPHKCDDLSWFDINDLPDNIIGFIKYALEQIKNNNFYSEYGWK